MKEQTYSVTYWPKGKPTESNTQAIVANSKEAAEKKAKGLWPNCVLKVKRRDYKWTGKGIVWHSKRRWAAEVT